MTTSAQSVFDAIRNGTTRSHKIDRTKLLTLEEQIEMKLNDPAFYTNSAIRYLQGYAYVFPGIVASGGEVERIGKIYKEQGWKVFIKHRGRSKLFIAITIWLRMSDEFTVYFDEVKGVTKKKETT